MQSGAVLYSRQRVQMLNGQHLVFSTGAMYSTKFISGRMARAVSITSGTRLSSLRHVQRIAVRFKVLASASEPNEQGGGPEDVSQQSPSPGPTATAIPVGLRTAGAVFVLAGFLKILIVCFPYSTMAISMYLQGRFDLGTLAAVKMIPFALGILAFAKALLDKQLHQRKWFNLAVVAGGVIALLLSRWAFARPRPGPLDPLIAAHQQAMAAAQAQQRERELAIMQQHERHLRPTGEARRMLEQKATQKGTSASGKRF